MCDVIARVAGDPSLPEANRRQFLKVLGTAVTAGGLLAAGAGSAQAHPSGSGGHTARGDTKLILLGTSGGPLFIQGDHFGISTAVVYKDAVYLVDMGLGALLRLRQSSASGELGLATALTKVRGIFFTHMHSDHLTDWPAAWAIGGGNASGRPASAGPIEVFGPGNRGTLPRVFPPGRPAPPLFNPADPTPGISGMSGYLTQAWANDLNDRARDSNAPRPESLFHVQDIPLDGIWSPDPEGVPPRLSSPIQVWTDGDVRVTATLVDHRPTAPAFGYRFDTPDGSVTISGDTTVSQNLIDLARDTDYLVHEVIDPEYVDRLVATLPPEVGGPARQHLLESHTTIEQVGRDVAEPAGARNLVLTHLAPGNNPEGRWRQAERGYSGRLIVGRDLLELAIA